MPRAIWKGAISFGLVYVPVEVIPATQSERTGFNLLDRRTLDPVGYRQINKRTGKPVEHDDIVRGYEYEKGAYVVIADEEIKAASPEATQTVDLLGFVEAAQVSFLYLDTPYWLAPDKRAGKTYALLRDALAASSKIGIANVVLHSRQHLAALVAAGPALALQTLRWSTEVREFDAVQSLPASAKAAGVSAHELQMARKLIDDMSTDWQPEAYRDTYRDAILELAERKVREGKAHEVTHVEAATHERRSADIVDLSELLKRSLGKRGGSRGHTGETRDGGAPPHGSTPKRSRRAA
ncbi:Ku protein [Paraburkholderia unamae]|uniref:Non-homologous end joining protein Ku n=1 Tax=Paraburkholderia unamae TaxID=219649 RepID=A0ABX5KW75_9BURK|nr:Ku protein [Paraburkholderia unamae]PVX85088.1 DNA end-binding protein Ku [Paraburkholderia unamae]CAG9245031.1 Non-homologous end joining protein Ku [Paraburkholderia unamae]